MTKHEFTPEEMEAIDLVRATHEQIMEDAKRLVELASATGFVLTIETSPQFPPAMGKYDMVATLRPSNQIYRSQS